MLEYSERQTKTRTGENPRDVRQIKPKMFSDPGSEKDPVAAYQLYAKKRPTEMNDSDAPFYLAINNCTKQESSKPWFKKSAVGQNKLNSLMRKMAEKAGLGPNVTNHSGRKTMIQDIIQLSRHKNLQSVTNYSVVPEKQQVKMSHTLSELSTGRSHVVEKSNLSQVFRPQFIQLVRPQIINKASKRCRSLPVLLFMVVNSTSLSKALMHMSSACPWGRTPGQPGRL